MIAASIAVVLTLVLDACTSGASSTGASATLTGDVRSPALRVGTATLPDVAPGRPDRPFAFRAPKGKLLFVMWGYTSCPDVCPTTMADLGKALRALGGDAPKVETAFVTIDPARDTPAKLTGYLTSFTSGGHAIRTTDAAALAKAEAAFQVESSVTKKADGTVEVAHTARSFVVDDHGRVVVEWPYGTGSDGMTHDLKILVARLTSSS